MHIKNGLFSKIECFQNKNIFIDVIYPDTDCTSQNALEFAINWIE